MILHIVQVISFLQSHMKSHDILFFCIIFDRYNIICLWAISVILCRRPYTSVDFSIFFYFFILRLTPFHISCFALLFWHFLALWFIKRDLFTLSFTGFSLVALLFIIHPAFLFWHFLTHLNLFRSTFFMRNLFTILNLQKRQKVNRSDRIAINQL